MNRKNFAAGNARRSKSRGHSGGIHRPENRLAAGPRHGDPLGLMNEVAEVQPEYSAAVRDNVADLVYQPRLAISGEPHHFVLISEAVKAEELSECGVEETERVREAHGALNVNPVGGSHAPHGARI